MYYSWLPFYFDTRIRQKENQLIHLFYSSCLSLFISLSLFPSLSVFLFISPSYISFSLKIKIIVMINSYNYKQYECFRCTIDLYFLLFIFEITFIPKKCRNNEFFLNSNFLSCYNFKSLYSNRKETFFRHNYNLKKVKFDLL